MQITDAESLVMEVLWHDGASTSDHIIALLADRHGWHESTIKTLLSRLTKKGAVRADSEGRRFRYVPLLTQREWVMQQSEGLLDRLFGGRIAPLVAQFSASGKLDETDLAELRKLIDGIDHGR
jgi:BlaI family transcriptional regulator, penicillinase repressor